jgi:hypothetical protein
MRQFAQAIRPLTRDDFPPVQEVAVCVRHESERDELAAALDGGRDAAR